MNKGIEILLERMKSNPEEFVHPQNNLYTQSKWGSLVAEYGEALDTEDIEAYKNAIKEMRKEQFTAEVMKELLDPKPLANPYLVQPSATRLGGATLGAYSNTATATLSASGNLTTNSITLGNQTLDESTIAHMKLHAEYMKAQIQAEKTKAKHWWNKSIPELFGKK